MGAWIEIISLNIFKQSFIVAPYLGAWIEIYGGNLAGATASTVAPYLGAWIEIPEKTTSKFLGMGRTLLGCVD